MVSPHETHQIIDSSKLQEYMTCPRKYFYRYMLGWSGTGSNIHLIFGEAWHRALETVLNEGYNEKAVKLGMAKFLDYYRQYYTEDMDSQFRPKDPVSAYMALMEYIKHYEDDDFTVLYTEVHGTVPITENQMLTMRIDAVCMDKEDKVFVLEHKSGSYRGGTWTNQWFLKTQVGAYIHALYCLFDPKNVYGLIINGTFFYKTKTEFERVRIRKHKRMMQIWLDNVSYYMKQIKENTELMYEEQGQDNPIMKSFPMNTESCTKWNRTCMFHDFCSIWENPLKRCATVPQGFVERWWNPMESDKKATKMEAGVIVK